MYLAVYVRDYEVFLEQTVNERLFLNLSSQIIVKLNKCENTRIPSDAPAHKITSSKSDGTPSLLCM